jgi:WD40 repeat protein
MHCGTDVFQVEWSSDGTYLASCGVEAVCYIWNMASFGASMRAFSRKCVWMYTRICVCVAVVARLEGHTGMIKGLAWDPIMSYLITQVGLTD